MKSSNKIKTKKYLLELALIRAILLEGKGAVFYSRFKKEWEVKKSAENYKRQFLLKILIVKTMTKEPPSFY